LAEGLDHEVGEPPLERGTHRLTCPHLHLHRVIEPEGVVDRAHLVRALGELLVAGDDDAVHLPLDLESPRRQAQRTPGELVQRDARQERARVERARPRCQHHTRRPVAEAITSTVLAAQRSRSAWPARRSRFPVRR
jgi:hypothetical protein